MKKIVMMSLIVAGFSFAASAQTDRAMRPADTTRKNMRPPGPPNGDMRQRDEQMLKDLNLSDAQKAQVKKDREEMRPKMEALRNNTSLTPDQKRTQMQAIREEQKKKMDAILTPEQKAKMEAQRKKMQDDRKRPDMGNVDPKSSDNPNKNEPN